MRDGLGNLAAAREIESGLGLFTFGDEWYVNPDAVGANDDKNSGKSKAEPLKTVSEANDRATTNNDDIIYMSGNSAHALATQLTITKNRLHFVGASMGRRYFGQRTRWEMGVTSGAEVALCHNTGNGNTFHNIKMRSIDTNTSSLYCFADGGEHTILDGVALEHAALLGTALAAELLANGDTAQYLNCTIGNLIYQRTAATRSCILFKREVITGKVCRDAIFDGCYILNKAGATTSVHCHVPGATDIERMVVFDRCKFIAAKLGSATQARVFTITSAQTEGEILLVGGTASFNVTEIADTGEGVFTDHPSAVKDGPEGIGVAVS